MTVDERRRATSAIRSLLKSVEYDEYVARETCQKNVNAPKQKWKVLNRRYVSAKRLRTELFIVLDYLATYECRE